MTRKLGKDHYPVCRENYKNIAFDWECICHAIEQHEAWKKRNRKNKRLER